MRRGGSGCSKAFHKRTYFPGEEEEWNDLEHVSKEHAQDYLAFLLKEEKSNGKSKTQADLWMPHQHVVLPESCHFTHYISISFLWEREKEKCRGIKVATSIPFSRAITLNLLSRNSRLQNYMHMYNFLICKHVDI